MNRETLGNLEQWDAVLEQLDKWKQGGQLDSRQDDLLWLLRYRGNWRLREAALEMSAFLQAPTLEVIRQVSDIMMDENLYQEVRILAAETLGAILSNERQRGTITVPVDSEVRARMNALLASAQPPVMHIALRRILSQIE
jgi:hypothetical protein